MTPRHHVAPKIIAMGCGSTDSGILHLRIKFINMATPLDEGGAGGGKLLLYVRKSICSWLQSGGGMNPNTLAGCQPNYRVAASCPTWVISDSSRTSLFSQMSPKKGDQGDCGFKTSVVKPSPWSLVAFAARHYSWPPPTRVLERTFLSKAPPTGICTARVSIYIRQTTWYLLQLRESML